MRVLSLDEPSVGLDARRRTDETLRGGRANANVLRRGSGCQSTPRMEDCTYREEPWLAPSQGAGTGDLYTVASRMRSPVERVTGNLVRLRRARRSDPVRPCLSAGTACERGGNRAGPTLKMDGISTGEEETRPVPLVRWSLCRPFARRVSSCDLSPVSPRSLASETHH